jgi:Arc/MetJ family transcription regulator
MRTTIDIDKALAEEASKVLGTTTLKGTVNAALREVTAAARRGSLIERIHRGALPAPTPSELARLRAPKLPSGALSPRKRR